MSISVTRASYITLKILNSRRRSESHVKQSSKRIVVIKGNHDNYLFYVTRKYEVELLDSLPLDSFLFIHGDVVPEQKELEKAEIIIMGHEHPAIALFDEVGAVMPAFYCPKSKNIYVATPIWDD